MEAFGDVASQLDFILDEIDTALETGEVDVFFLQTLHDTLIATTAAFQASCNEFFSQLSAESKQELTVERNTRLRKKMRAESSIRAVLATLLNMDVASASDDKKAVLREPSHTSDSGNLAAVADAIAASQIKLDTFDGSPLAYSDFMASFNSQVHDRTTMPAAAKMQHLISHLSGNAKSAISPLPRDAEGYRIALDTLKSDYGKPSRIARAHLHRICDGARLTLKNGEGIRQFYHHLLAAQTIFRRVDSFHDVNAASSLIKLIQRLPSASHNRWRRKVQVIEDDGREPRFDDVVTFVKGESAYANNDVWCALENEKTSYAVNTLAHNQADSCLFCKQGHATTVCQDNSMTHADRVQMIYRARVCFRCFTSGHNSKSCPVLTTCTICHRNNHHTLMHRGNANRSSAATPSVATQAHVPSEVSAAPAAPAIESSVNMLGNAVNTLLQVVRVTISGPKGSTSVNAMLDTGSQVSLLCADVASQVGLGTGLYEDFQVNTLTGATKMQRSERLVIKLSGTDHSQVTINDVYSIKGLALPYHSLLNSSVTSLAHLRDVPLSATDGHISLLIGANAAHLHVQLDTVSGCEGDPVAILTPLGWTLLGGSQQHQSNFIGFASADSLEGQWDRFWNVASLREVDAGTSEPYSQHDRLALLKLQELKIVDGHYSVGLLWKPGVYNIPNNRAAALSRLLSLKRSLSKDDLFAAKYATVMQGYINDGFASCLTPTQLAVVDPRTWYLPHFAVLNPKKPDKVRIVFDAAAKFHGSSLNDFLMSGPDCLNSLLGCLLRFRQGHVALLADIQSMYHMVHVDQSDRNAFRFLWWEKGDVLGDRIVEYRMNVHVFGAICSPCCAISALRKIGSDQCDVLGPAAVHVLLSNFYVDDLVCSVDSVSTAIETARVLCDVLASCGFRLTKWLSNSDDVMKSIPVTERSNKTKKSDLAFDGGLTERALGVKWNVSTDTISFQVDRQQFASFSASKRGILATISTMFNPDGFLSPIFLTPKLLMRELWQSNADWDAPLPAHIAETWVQWLEQISCLEDIALPRCYSASYSTLTPDHVGLHIFCDASLLAFGVVAYLRFVFGNEIYCAFVVGKSRCAPIKAMTIPRLELQAAVLGTRVNTMLTKEMTIVVDEIVYWSDSKTTLAYIANSERRFHTFVANRVSEIRGASQPCQWRFCPGILNPADIASRGLQPEALATSVWGSGPAFLWAGCQSWPTDQTPEETDEQELELKAVQIGAIVIGSEDNFLDILSMKHSSFHKLQRTVARVLQFVHAVQKKRLPHNGCALPTELLYKATCVIVKHAQGKAFSSEIALLKANKKLGSRCSLISLSPILDEEGLLRVGGRLTHADLDADARNPLLVPSSSQVAIAIIHDAHLQLKHTGVDATVTHIRQRFWVPKLKSKVRHYAHACMRCRQLSAKAMQQFMAPLPKFRVTLSNAFDVCGVDYFGPVKIKILRSEVKHWCCLFTCLTTRAVHLETTSSLDTDSFICVLRRFQARRGQPSEMHSDNGTNFVGAEKELRECIKVWNVSKIEAHLQQTGTSWHFNTPTAAHQGGAWERMVRSVKRCLRAVLVDKMMKLEVFQTVLAEVEFVVNSRPLTHMSDDPNDLAPLTPNHLLMSKSTPTLPPGEFEPSDVLLRKRWRKSQAIADEFWVRWRKEYLVTLQQRKKWNVASRNVAIGDVVLVMDDNIARAQYPLGIVTKVFPGQDGLIRSVVVRTTANTLRRPVTKLCLLEAVDN